LAIKVTYTESLTIGSVDDNIAPLGNSQIITPSGVFNLSKLSNCLFELPGLHGVGITLQCIHNCSSIAPV
jgi:hypothetical protein